MRDQLKDLLLAHRRCRENDSWRKYACICGEPLRSNSHHVLAEHQADVLRKAVIDAVEYEYAVARPASMPDMSGRETYTILSRPINNYVMAEKDAKRHPPVKGTPAFIVARPVGEWGRVDQGDGK